MGTRSKFTQDEVNESRDRLIGAGAEALADALLRLAERHEDAANAVERLTT